MKMKSEIVGLTKGRGANLSSILIIREGFHGNKSAKLLDGFLQSDHVFISDILSSGLKGLEESRTKEKCDPLRSVEQHLSINAKDPVGDDRGLARTSHSHVRDWNCSLRCCTWAFG